MKRARTALVALVTALGFWGAGLSSTHAAGAGAVSYTQQIHNQTDIAADVNPCTGAPGTLTQTYNAVFHITALADGEYWATFTQTGSMSFEPNDSSQPSYSGHFTVWGGENLNERNATGTFTFNLHVTGTDGSMITAHELAHYTVTATDVTYSFDRPEMTCG